MSQILVALSVTQPVTATTTIGVNMVTMMVMRRVRRMIITMIAGKHDQLFNLILSFDQNNAWSAVIQFSIPDSRSSFFDSTA